jgi:hypothetical protein
LTSVNYGAGMARKVDPADLVDSAGVAAILGLGNVRSVSVIRARHDDFPAPTVDMGAGRCLLWHRADVQAWARKTGRLS